ncbi:MAG: pseudouridine-5'-phosphate glycosidase [Gemmatimonadaceae bacterium]
MTAIRLTPEVADALHRGAPVVALESSVLAQGLPIPVNREAALRMTRAVRDAGAVPAITAVVGGTVAAGLTDAELERFLAREGVGKVSARDLPVAVSRGADGATTVAASLVIAHRAGIRVFATGGLGGVHREPPYDESADLTELARTSVVVVCAGAKAILDLPATAERLETLGVTVVGYRTWELPGFFTVATGIRVTARAESAAGIAAIYRAGLALGRPGALVVVQPPPAELALSAQVVDAAVERALERARAEGVRGAGVTPFLLAAVERETDGRSLEVNLALLESNARLAAGVASALAALPGAGDDETTTLANTEGKIERGQPTERYPR